MNDKFKQYLKNPVYDNMLWKRISNAINMPGYYLSGERSFYGLYHYIKGLTDGFSLTKHYTTWWWWEFYYQMQKKYGEEKDNFYFLYLQDRDDAQAFDALVSDIRAFLADNDMLDYFRHVPSINIVSNNNVSYQLPVQWTVERDDTSFSIANSIGRSVLNVSIKDISEMLSNKRVDIDRARSDLAVYTIYEFMVENGIKTVPPPKNFCMPPVHKGEYKTYHFSSVKPDGQYIRMYSITYNNMNVMAYYTGEEGSYDELFADMIVSGMEFLI